MEKDHEFPWIEFNISTRDMICTRCKAEGSTNAWLEFLAKHSKCNESEKQEITKDDVGDLESILGNNFFI